MLCGPKKKKEREEKKIKNTRTKERKKKKSNFQIPSLGFTAFFLCGINLPSGPLELSLLLLAQTFWVVIHPPALALFIEHVLRAAAVPSTGGAPGNEADGVLSSRVFPPFSVERQMCWAHRFSHI